MRRYGVFLWLAFFLAFALPSASQAQAQIVSAVPAFDVLSVRPDNSGSTGGSISLREDGLYVQHAPFRFLIIAAFGHDFAEGHIVNMPAWASDPFDVAGKVAVADLPKLHGLDREHYIEMRSKLLQAMLAERFALKTHTEVREGRVYALVAAKGGPKIKPSGENPPKEYVSPEGQHVQMGTMAVTGHIAGHAVSMAMLVRSLNGAGQLDRVVVDRTGLAGNFDYALNWAPDQATGADPVDTNLPPLFTAIQEQLGLKLEPATGPINTLVIDHVEKPSGN